MVHAATRFINSFGDATYGHASVAIATIADATCLDAERNSKEQPNEDVKIDLGNMMML
jgi:hypothetical protein